MIDPTEETGTADAVAEVDPNASPDDASVIADDPMPDREADPYAFKLWRDRNRKRRKRAAETASAVAEQAEQRDAADAEPEAPSAPSAAQVTAAKVKRRGRPRGSRNKAAAPVAGAIERQADARARLEQQAAQLCGAMARGLLSIIPPEYGGGDPDPDAGTLGDAWAPVVAPMLADAGEGTAPLYLAIGVTVQVLLVRAVGAYHARRLPAGYTVPAPAPAAKDADARDVAASLDRERAGVSDAPTDAGLVAGYSPSE